MKPPAIVRYLATLSPRAFKRAYYVSMALACAPMVVGLVKLYLAGF